MFYLKLALRLGRTVPELLDACTSEELTEWMAFDRLEPLGDARMDLGFGIVAAAVANWAGKTLPSGTDPLKPSAFMPLARIPERKQTLATKMRTFFSGFGKKRKEA